MSASMVLPLNITELDVEGKALAPRVERAYHLVKRRGLSQ
jgi:hypothetical protein